MVSRKGVKEGKREGGGEGEGDRILREGKAYERKR